MASKDELQTALKQKYGINKNISQPLAKEECERLLFLLNSEPSAVRLIESFAEKNSSLGSKNAYYSRMRNQAENKLTSLQAEYRELEESIKNLEAANTVLEARKKQLEQNRDKLEAEIQSLSSENKTLDSKVQSLTSEKNELAEVNDTLKKDNRLLKNLVDALKLRLAIDIKRILQYKDGEIRQALVKWFKGIQG